MHKYTELHCLTNFSFLTGASHADELVQRAVELGYHALAVTDHDSIAGIVRAHSAAKEFGLHLIVGAQLNLLDAPPVVVWIPDRASYGRLCRLLTVGRRRAEKGSCELYFADLAAHAAGMLAGIVADDPPPESLDRYRELFGERAYLLAHLHHGPDDQRKLQRLKQQSRDHHLPLVAAGNVHYHAPERLLLHDVLTAIRLGTSVDRLGEARFANAQRHLRSIDELAHIYRSVPEALARTSELANRCTFSLDELRYEYPEELAPDGLTPFEYLQKLVWEGAARRYPTGISDKVRALIDHELALIHDMHYEAYFLTVWDLVRYARSRNILCQGRGSAANSAVCFCLEVTAVDPETTDVLFERFISRERNEAPDIDVDFEHERREEVLQYLYERYGRERAGLAAVVVTYRLRSAIRDAGKALGLSLDCVDALAKQVDGYYSTDQDLPLRCRQVGFDPDSTKGQELLTVVEQLVGFPRHLSQHVGGMVMTQGPLCELVPIENAAMEGRTVICWDKNDLEDLGILKVDCLALGMLTAIRKAFDLIDQHAGRRWTLANIPPDDPDVYDMICRADTIGVFQIESRAQMSMLPRLQPRCYYDLVIEVAIVRPGPIQGQMVHPYLRRRAGDEEVVYANDAIREVLQKTMGVPIFQEQAMRLAVVAAGFTPGEADQLRRAMGKWRKTGVIDTFRRKLIEGMLARGLTEEFALQVFQQIRGFGEYGFPESHAASFALLVYVSAWLKHHYPAAFCAAIINSHPMGFYAPAQLIRDAQEHGVEMNPVDVNHSDWDFSLEASSNNGRNPETATPLETSATSQEPAPWGKMPVVNNPAHIPQPLTEGHDHQPAIRIGLRTVAGLSHRHAEQLIAARGAKPFTSQDDFTRRTQLPRSVIKQLAAADALASLGRDRRQALWEALAQEKAPRDTPLFDQLIAEDELPVDLPELAPLENVFADYQTKGHSLRNHPVSFYRTALATKHVVTAADLAELPSDRIVKVAGIVLLRQRPSTAKGITFVTLEDETGTTNLVIHQATWERFYPIAKRSPAWIARGTLESRHSVIHVIVKQLYDFGEFVGDTENQIAQRARNFR
jgi:error-prone DNA polymerase